MTRVISITEQAAIVVSSDGAQVVSRGGIGPQGPQGEQGPQGPQGTSGDANFTQAFSSATNVTVNHNLGKYPAVTVLDSAGDECEGDVDYNNINSLTLRFSAPFSGVVSCN